MGKGDCLLPASIRELMCCHHTPGDEENPLAKGRRTCSPVAKLQENTFGSTSGGKYLSITRESSPSCHEHSTPLCLQLMQEPASSLWALGIQSCVSLRDVQMMPKPPAHPQPAPVQNSRAAPHKTMSPPAQRRGEGALPTTVLLQTVEVY